MFDYVNHVLIFPLTYLMYKFRKFKLVCLILITSVKVQDTFVYNSKKTRGKFKKNKKFIAVLSVSVGNTSEVDNSCSLQLEDKN